VLGKFLKYTKSGTTIYYIVDKQDNFLKKYITLRLDFFHSGRRCIHKIDGKKSVFFSEMIFTCRLNIQ